MMLSGESLIYFMKANNERSNVAQRNDAKDALINSRIKMGFLKI